MGATPVEQRRELMETIEAQSVRIEQLHAELQRIQQPRPLPTASVPDGADPWVERARELRGLAERVDELEAERDLLQAHISGLESSRVLRWTRIPRTIYSRCRRVLRR